MDHVTRPYGKHAVLSTVSSLTPCRQLQSVKHFATRTHHGGRDVGLETGGTEPRISAPNVGVHSPMRTLKKKKKVCGPASGPDRYGASALGRPTVPDPMKSAQLMHFLLRGNACDAAESRDIQESRNSRRRVCSHHGPQRTARSGLSTEFRGGLVRVLTCGYRRTENSWAVCGYLDVSKTVPATSLASLR